MMGQIKIFYERRDDRAKGAADDNGDREIKNVAPQKKLLEARQHVERSSWHVG